MTGRDANGHEWAARNGGLDDERVCRRCRATSNARDADRQCQPLSPFEGLGLAPKE